MLEVNVFDQLCHICCYLCIKWFCESKVFFWGEKTQLGANSFIEVYSVVRFISHMNVLWNLNFNCRETVKRKIPSNKSFFFSFLCWNAVFPILQRVCGDPPLLSTGNAVVEYQTSGLLCCTPIHQQQIHINID